ncbi:MAG: NRDE family protein [Synechococcaceae cyanobacterium SM1_2_3]|nr:NRDE family protein [Synechococcaceae cyanobacterium SM1_2_3]
MCLILIAYRCHPRYPLLVAANRDEFYDRPAAPLGFWHDLPQILAGRDLQKGGTWMGVTQNGRFAALTNYREPSRVMPDAPSRGCLVSDYLCSVESARVYLDRLAWTAEIYNGFNLLLGDAGQLYYYSNRGGGQRVLTPGIYGLSNHLLDTPWPKLERGRRALGQLLDRQVALTPDDLLDVLTNCTPAPDEDLPDTGVSLEWERWLSPIFIDAPGYGTRCSTALLLDASGRAQMVETTWATGRQREFQWDCPMGFPA